MKRIASATLAVAIHVRAKLVFEKRFFAHGFCAALCSLRGSMRDSIRFAQIPANWNRERFFCFDRFTLRATVFGLAPNMTTDRRILLTGERACGRIVRKASG